MSTNSLPTSLLSVFSDRRPKLPPAEDGADNGAGRGGESSFFFTNSLCLRLSAYNPRHIPRRLNNLSSGGCSEEPAGAVNKRADQS